MYTTDFGEDLIKIIGTQIPISSLVPGDFLFYEVGKNGTSHISVYVGNGKAVHGGMGGIEKQEVRLMGIYLSSHPQISAWRVPYDVYTMYRYPGIYLK